MEKCATCAKGTKGKHYLSAPVQSPTVSPAASDTVKSCEHGLEHLPSCTHPQEEHTPLIERHSGSKGTNPRWHNARRIHLIVAFFAPRMKSSQAVCQTCGCGDEVMTDLHEIVQLQSITLQQPGHPTMHRRAHVRAQPIYKN